MLDLLKFTFNWHKDTEILYHAEMSLFEGKPVYIVMWNKENELQGIVYTMAEVIAHLQEKRWNIVDIIAKIEE